MLKLTPSKSHKLLGLSGSLCYKIFSMFFRPNAVILTRIFIDVAANILFTQTIRTEDEE